MFDRALETLQPDRLREHQWRRFRAMSHKLLATNEFVAQKWRGVGVAGAEDLRDWLDFRRLPLTSKFELVADQAAHPPFGTNLTYPLERYVRVHQTSGTSGVPFRWLDTQESWEWWARCWGFVLRGAGVGPADRIFFPFSFGLFIGFWAGFEGARALGALAIPGGGQDSPTRLASMQALGATVLVCTPSYALHLIEVARERGLDLASWPVRTTVHAGEPGAGIPAVRARIEAGWQARTFDHGGMTETGAYGYECAEQAGLHVNESEFILEVIDPATSEPATDGELVLTNLGRIGSPVIRYRTGDHVRLAEEICPCGRTFRRLAGGILGRLDDMLIVRGVNVFPAAIEGVVRRFSGIDEFQIEVFKDAELEPLRAAARRGRREFAAAFAEATKANPRLGSVAPVVLYRTLGETLPNGADAAAALWPVAHRCASMSPDSVRRAGFGEGLEAGENLFDAIVAGPSGVVFAVDDYDETLRRIQTDDGRVKLSIPELLGELDALRTEVPPGDDPAWPFMLSAGERRSFTANTIIRDPSWRKLDADIALRVSPSDAARIGVVGGGQARLTTKRASAIVAVAVDEAMAAGHLALPNGLGLDHLEGAQRIRTGVGPNEFTASEDRDPWVGTPWHKSIPARLEAIPN